MKVVSEPQALLAVMKNPAYRFKRIGLEAGPLSQWRFSAVAEAELPVICVETRHMRAVLKAQINKTDRNDARDSELLKRAFLGWLRGAHPRTSQYRRTRWLSCVATWSGDGSSGIRSGRLRRHAWSGSITRPVMDRTLWCAYWRA